MMQPATILGPVETEKSVRLSQKSQYTVWVSDAATKPAIRMAIKALTGKDPEHVTIQRTHDKFRGGNRRKRRAAKKAIITFASGTVIDLAKIAST